MAQKKSRSLTLDIRLTSKQNRMFNLLNEGKYKEVLFYGSSRSGKTFVIIYWLIVQSVVYGANCLVLRNLFTSLQLGMIQQTLPAVLKAIAQANGYNSIDKVKMSDGTPFCKFNGRDNYLKFFNDAYIQFASLRGSSDTDATFDKILSSEWGFIFVDEVSEVEERAIDVLRTRLAQKLPVRNKLLFALNPTRKSGWTYVRFFKHETREGIAIPKDVVAGFLVVKFTLNDNMDNIAADYEETLKTMSTLQRKRFLDGDYFDESEGEIFKKINWSDVSPETVFPRPEEWQDLIIYTDPSAKESKKNDFKASVLLGRARGKIWLIDVRAVQGTSLQMLENIRELYSLSPNKMITRIVMENKQVPLDFKVTFQRFQEETGWVCPLSFDNRSKMGDKFTMIESTLEPLFAYDKFIFNSQLKDSSRGEEAVNQFLFFSRKIDHDRKDDIPDACAKGASLLNRGNSSTATGYKDIASMAKPQKRPYF